MGRFSVIFAGPNQWLLFSQRSLLQISSHPNLHSIQAIPESLSLCYICTIDELFNPARNGLFIRDTRPHAETRAKEVGEGNKERAELAMDRSLRRDDRTETCAEVEGEGNKERAELAMDQLQRKDDRTETRAEVEGEIRNNVGGGEIATG